LKTQIWNHLQKYDNTPVQTRFIAFLLTAFELTINAD